MMKQIKFIQPQHEMVIVGVSIDLTTHADVPTRVRNVTVWEHTKTEAVKTAVRHNGGGLFSCYNAFTHGHEKTASKRFFGGPRRPF